MIIKDKKGASSRHLPRVFRLSGARPSSPLQKGAFGISELSLTRNFAPPLIKMPVRSNRTRPLTCNHLTAEAHHCVAPSTAARLRASKAPSPSPRRGRKKNHRDPPDMVARILLLPSILRDAMQYYAGDLLESRIEILRYFEAYMERYGEAPITSDKKGAKGGSKHFACQVCPETRESLQKIMAHLLSHSGLKPWRCILWLVGSVPGTLFQTHRDKVTGHTAP